MTDRRRNLGVIGLVALLAIGAALVSFGISSLVKPKKTRLGLDLQGGVELIYQGKATPQSPVNSDSLNRAIDIIRQRVDQLGVSEPTIGTVGSDQIAVDLPSVKDATRAAAQVGQVAQMYFYDWEPNVIGPNGQPDPTNAAVTGGGAAGEPGTGVPLYQAIQIAAKRPAILRHNDTTPTGTWYLVNDTAKSVLRGPEDNRAALFSETQQPPGTRVVEVMPGTVLVQAQTPKNAPDPKLNSYYVLNDNPVLKGSDIRNPAQTFDNGTSGTGQPIVTFGFSSSGGKIFQNVTRQIAQRGQNVSLPGQPNNQHFAVVLDGRLVTVPFIDFTQNPDGIDPSNGSQIQGGFTIDSAQQLANLLKTGALPIKLVPISTSQVSATLGKQALNQGLIAGLVGFAVVALFLVAFYRVLGVIAVAALLIYALYFFALIKLIPITLTLPGIAGLILTIGVAADANIVIFERVKEELRAGRSVAGAITHGYRRGLAAIIDANVVTFMTAFILFVLATAGVKGFALVLGIGTLVSLFTAVAATQAILGTMGRSRLIHGPAALGAHQSARRWSFDFMGRSKWFFSLSGTILLVGALAIGGKGLTFGIDFKSGTQIKTAFVQPANENQVRSVLAADGFPDAEIQRITSKDIGGHGFQISTKTLRPDKLGKVQTDLSQRFGGVRNFSSTSIGPTFGKTVAHSAVIAIIASLLVISIYIALRFEWKYAVPVLIALMHDLLITAGVYSLTGREVTTSTVAALLTILGYSLYDTIIVFDRVRENVPRMPRAAFSQIVNRSMSEVLTRSLATSFCTLLPIISLLLFGGQTLKDFAFALMVGVASGAYSSIFIASPVLTHWKEREPAYARRRARIASEHGGRVPAYAVAAAGVPVDVEPEKPRRALQRDRLTTPDAPDRSLSRAEFDELVRDLDIEETATPADPTADALPEDVVMPTAPGRASLGGGYGAPAPKGSGDGERDKPKRDKSRRQRNRRHGRPR
jgi:SecD/SecF fusion protein